MLNLKDSIVYSFQLTFRGHFQEWLTSVLQYAYLMRLLYHQRSAICLRQPLVCQSCSNESGWLFQFLNLPILQNDELSDCTLPATLRTKGFVIISKNGFFSGHSLSSFVLPGCTAFLFTLLKRNKPFSPFHSDLCMI